MKALAAVRRHRLDVDDRALDLLALHDQHGALNQEERRAHIDVEDLVVALFGGVEDVAAIGDASGVDERVDAAEAAIGFANHSAAVGDFGKVRPDEIGGTAGLRNRRRDAFAVGGVAPADDKARRAALGEQPGDRFAHALSAAGDDGVFSIEISGPVVRRAQSWVRQRDSSSSGCSSLAGRIPPRLRECVGPLMIMKQKFYSQVKVECVFFFRIERSANPPSWRWEEQMRFGVIGAGRIGKIHAANIAQRPDA